jgi:N-acyl-D-aspartate/D-glutamate deacylase
MSQPSHHIDEDDIDDLESEIDDEEVRRPVTRARIDHLTEFIRVTTALWQRRQTMGMTEEEVAERSGLTLEEVEAVEDNAVDASFDVLRRYAAAVGLQFDLRASA